MWGNIKGTRAGSASARWASGTSSRLRRIMARVVAWCRATASGSLMGLSARRGRTRRAPCDARARVRHDGLEVAAVSPAGTRGPARPVDRALGSAQRVRWAWFPRCARWHAVRLPSSWVARNCVTVSMDGRDEEAFGGARSPWGAPAPLRMCRESCPNCARSLVLEQRNRRRGRSQCSP